MREYALCLLLQGVNLQNNPKEITKNGCIHFSTLFSIAFLRKVIKEITHDTV
jgi:hypothetical protein